MRNFNLATPIPLLSIEYVNPTMYSSSTQDGPIQVITSSTESPPLLSIGSNSLTRSVDQELEIIPWNALIVDAILPTVALLLFYVFWEICLVLYRIAKIKAKNPRIPFAQTLYYSVFATAILGKQLYIYIKID